MCVVALCFPVCICVLDVHLHERIRTRILLSFLHVFPFIFLCVVLLLVHDVGSRHSGADRTSQAQLDRLDMCVGVCTFHLTRSSRRCSERCGIASAR